MLYTLNQEEIFKASLNLRSPNGNFVPCGLLKASNVSARRLNIHFVQVWMRSLRVNASIHHSLAQIFSRTVFLKQPPPQPKFLFRVQLVRPYCDSEPQNRLYKFFINILCYLLHLLGIELKLAAFC